MERVLVLQRGRELTAKSSFYELEYEGKKHRVPLFAFQEDMDVPASIWCKIDNGRPRQAYQNVFDVFYQDLDAEYVFKVRDCWPKARYYELEDPRIGDDSIHHVLGFQQSNSTLRKGQFIRCKIDEIKDDKLRLRLTDSHPSLIPFSSYNQVFFTDENPQLAQWLKDFSQNDYMRKVNALYNLEDGRWILVFSVLLEKAALTILEQDNEGKEELLAAFCNGWLQAVERSTFVRDMSEYEKAKYNAHLSQSIEICEDMLEAAQTPNKGEVAKNSIQSLNPQFYQYRVEKRLRFLAYTFCTRHDLMLELMPTFLEQLKLMGEKMCCDDRIARAIITILKTYVTHATKEVEQALSVNAQDTLTIKQGVLALCFLLRILRNKNSVDEPLYLSKLFQLLSLFNIGTDEKKKLIKNAYAALFATSSSVNNYSWDEFDNIVRNQIFRFSTAIISVDKNKIYSFDNGNTQALFAHNSLDVAPFYTTDSNKNSMKMMDDLDVRLSYGKSLSRIAADTEMLNIQNAWNSVASSVFAQAQKPKQTEELDQVNDGDRVWIYLTGRVDEYTASCKVVDYGDEGTILYKDMLYYAKPYLDENDFLGSNGSPLVFDAVCHKANGTTTFDMNAMKSEMTDENLLIGETICFVTQQKSENQYLGITPNGFFVQIESEDELKRWDFVLVNIVERLRNGNGKAFFVAKTPDTFDTRRTYPNFLRLLNKYCSETGREQTLADMLDEDHAQASVLPSRQQTAASQQFVASVAEVLQKYSRLENETRLRYAYFSVADILCRLSNNEAEHQLMAIRLKYTTNLYNFSLNNSILTTDYTEFAERVAALPQTPELAERKHVVEVLAHYGKSKYEDKVDDTLFDLLRNAYSSPIVKELAKLVLASQMLSLVKNKALEDQLLNELGEVLNINMIKQSNIHIGEESQTMEFKTSLIFPPANRGHIDIEQQSDNIVRVVLSMMNTSGGTLYIGVNDEGNVIGLRNDLEYFSEKGKYDEAKSRDLFSNFFSCLMKERIGAEKAMRLQFGFEEHEGYVIFKVQIPEMPDPNINYVRIGATSQRK